MRISDWSSDVCSSDLPDAAGAGRAAVARVRACLGRRYAGFPRARTHGRRAPAGGDDRPAAGAGAGGRGGGRGDARVDMALALGDRLEQLHPPRSEEHTPELQSIMRISYAVVCLKKKK